jgi:hypothetical protein
MPDNRQIFTAIAISAKPIQLMRLDMGPLRFVLPTGGQETQEIRFVETART